jgi:putative tricarboxylic transport membrane protein
VGIDALSGQARLTLGVPYLLDGVDPVIAAVGLFAVGDALAGLAGRGVPLSPPDTVGARMVMTRSDWARSWPAWLRGTIIGFPLGALPAGGAELPTMVSYSVERRTSRRPEEFGRGAIEGVAGPEAANNASATGTLVPLLSLGLPTSATAAVLLAALQQFGLQPGPLLFEREPDLVWGLIASLYVGNVMLLVLNLPLARFWVTLLSIPAPQLYAGILVAATLGAYSVHRSVGDLLLLAVIGMLGWGLRRIGAPVAPVMIGLMLGPVADQQLRRALAIGNGDWTVFVTRPIAASLLVAAGLLAVWRSRPRLTSPTADAPDG